MAKPLPGTSQSPWVYQADDYQGRILRITVTFNNSTRALTGATIERDPGCLYQTIYFGVGADGKPESTARQFTAPEGTTNISKTMLAQGGLDTIEDILAGQITAGP